MVLPICLPKVRTYGSSVAGVLDAGALEEGAP